MVHHIPKQFKDKEFGRRYKRHVLNAEQGVKGSLIMTIFTNLLIAGSISLIWSFINALQMMMFIAMC